MRLTLILPPVRPEVYPAGERCPYAGCGGAHYQRWQAVPKPLRETVLTEVVARRERCVRCGALGWPLSKVAVYYEVQEAAAAVARLRRKAVARGGSRVAVGADLTSVRCPTARPPRRTMIGGDDRDDRALPTYRAPREALTTAATGGSRTRRYGPRSNSGKTSTVKPCASARWRA